MFIVFCVGPTAQSLLSYSAFLGADASAFMPLCPAQFIVTTHCVHLCCSVCANNDDDDDDDDDDEIITDMSDSESVR